MSNETHIFTPQDDSLEARINAYKAMRKELHNIKKSQELSQVKEWQDRLGTEEELKQAHNIIENSLRATLNNIRDVDLHNAQEQGLMNTEEVSEFSTTKQSYGKSADSKQAQIDKNKAKIQKNRVQSGTKKNDKER